MQTSQYDLHSQRLIHGLGMFTAASVVICFTWLLLVPDPYAASRSFEPLRQARISGYLIHPCVYFLMATVMLINVPARDSRLRGQIVLLIIAHGLVTEVLQHFIPGRSCDPLDALANLSGIAVAVSVDRLRRGLFGAYWRIRRLAYID